MCIRNRAGNAPRTHRRAREGDLRHQLCERCPPRTSAPDAGAGASSGVRGPHHRNMGGPHREPEGPLPHTKGNRARDVSRDSGEDFAAGPRFAVVARGLRGAVVGVPIVVTACARRLLRGTLCTVSYTHLTLPTIYSV